MFLWVGDNSVNLYDFLPFVVKHAGYDLGKNIFLINN